MRNNVNAIEGIRIRDKRLYVSFPMLLNVAGPVNYSVNLSGIEEEFFTAIRGCLECSDLKKQDGFVKGDAHSLTFGGEGVD